LDSPERGEGRWAQNLARLLGESGHTVIASSGGNPTIGKGRPFKGVRMVNENDVKSSHPMFDLSIDPAWWDGKPPLVNAKKYLRLHFSPEDRVVHKKLPENEYLIYPYRDSENNFLDPRNVNLEKTFLLPTTFGKEFSEPGFDRTGIMWPSRFDFTPAMKKTSEEVLEFIIKYRESNDINMYWLFWNTWVKGNFGRLVDSSKDKIYYTLPYCDVRDIERKCKISVPINLPSCILDATFDGVATIVWEKGGFFQDIAESNGLLVRADEGIDGFKRVFSILSSDRQVYTKFVKDLQYKLRDHTDEMVLQHFNRIVSAIF
jgi:hypothetical protein